MARTRNANQQDVAMVADTIPKLLISGVDKYGSAKVAVKRRDGSASRDMAACERLLKWGVEEGEFEIGNPPVVAHNMIVLGHMWAIRRWFLRKCCTLEKYIREQAELILAQCVCTKTYLTEAETLRKEVLWSSAV